MLFAMEVPHSRRPDDPSIPLLLSLRGGIHIYELEGGGCSMLGTGLVGATRRRVNHLRGCDTSPLNKGADLLLC